VTVDLTTATAAVTVLALVALGLREWVSVRRGPGVVARGWDAGLVVLVLVFLVLMYHRLTG
jgi:hypothetical protein